MKTPEMYIESLEISLEPNIEDIDMGGVDIEFEIDENPDFLENKGRLEAEFTLECSLIKYPTPFHSSTNENESENEIGEFETDVITVVEGEKEEFEEYLDTWEKEGYQSISQEFRYYIEYGFLTEIFAPISKIIDNSFRGVLPGLMFTESEKESLDLDPKDYQDEFLTYILEKEITELMEENGIDEENSNIKINIPEEGDETISIYASEEVSSLIEEDETIRQSVHETTELVFNEVADASVREISTEIYKEDEE